MRREQSREPDPELFLLGLGENTGSQPCAACTVRASYSPGFLHLQGKHTARPKTKGSAHSANCCQGQACFCHFCSSRAVSVKAASSRTPCGWLGVLAFKPHNTEDMTARDIKSIFLCFVSHKFTSSMPPAQKQTQHSEQEPATLSCGPRD